MGLATSSSPGLFQSIMPRVCEGLECCKLVIDDVVIFSRTSAEHVKGMEKFFACMAKFNLKMARRKRIWDKGGKVPGT